MVRLLLLGAMAFAVNATAIAQRVLSPDEAKPILDSFYSALHDAKTLHVSESLSFSGVDFKLEHRLMKPALYRSTLKGVKGERRPTDIRVYANAKEVYVLDMRGKTVSILRRTTDSPTISGFEPFLQKERPQYTLTGRVTETSFHHKPAYSIEVKTDKATASLGSVVIDPVSFLPLGWTYVRGNSEVTIGYQVTLNEPMQEKDFSTTLPKGFRLLVDQRSQPAH